MVKTNYMTSDYGTLLDFILGSEEEFKIMRKYKNKVLSNYPWPFFLT